ncbi:MAG: hypothetical protein KF900_07915 [Bacteroidetes bacterium]|nr:hypothetical protein [Bacteroidota bacterium]
MPKGNNNKNPYISDKKYSGEYENYIIPKDADLQGDDTPSGWILETPTQDFGASKYDKSVSAAQLRQDPNYVSHQRQEGQIRDLKNALLIAVPFFLLALIFFIRRKMRS